LLLNALAGTKFKVVQGYKSTSEILLAVERGEVDGLCGFDASSFQAQRPSWYGTNLANMIVQASLEAKEELTKLGALAAPFLTQVVGWMAYQGVADTERK